MFDVSKNAIERIKEIALKEKHEYFRISVDGGGCQGFSYKFNFDKKINDEDKIFKFNDVKILIDQTSLNLKILSSSLIFLSKLNL